MPKINEMTRDQLIHFIHSSGCKMLKKLHLKNMTKEDIIKHLKESKCPEIKKIL